MLMNIFKKIIYFFLIATFVILTGCGSENTAVDGSLMPTDKPNDVNHYIEFINKRNEKLQYTANDDCFSYKVYESYVVIDGIISADSVCSIPESYDGLPVRIFDVDKEKLELFKTVQVVNIPDSIYVLNVMPFPNVTEINFEGDMGLIKYEYDTFFYMNNSIDTIQNVLNAKSKYTNSGLIEEELYFIIDIRQRISNLEIPCNVQLEFCQKNYGDFIGGIELLNVLEGVTDLRIDVEYAFGLNPYPNYFTINKMNWPKSLENFELEKLMRLKLIQTYKGTEGISYADSNEIEVKLLN